MTGCTHTTSENDMISKDFVMDALDTIKTEFDLLCNNPDEFEHRQNVRDYAEIHKQIKVMQPIVFGTSVNVLLITDRLHGCATGLREYLQNSKDISVDFVNNFEDAKHIIQHRPIDFLIIVGFLKVKKNYAVIEYAERVNKYASIIMYANLDSVIKTVCAENKIKHSYERKAPIDGLISYMRQLFKQETERIHREISPEATRE